MTECRYKGWCRIEYDTDFDVCYPCIGDGIDTCARYEPMPDVAALLALADDMSKDADVLGDGYGMAPHMIRTYAGRIREALG